MKKSLIFSLVMAFVVSGVFFNASATHAQVQSSVSLAQPIPENSNGIGQCVRLTRYLGHGSRASEVSMLQQFLFENNYLSVTPTGYFGALTRAAVIKFQRENGIAQTGTVGPLTRAKFAVISCKNPEWYINVTSPTKDAQWTRGSIQTISWDSKLPPSFAAYQYTVSLVPLRGGCPVGVFCAMNLMMVRPYTIIESTLGNSISWRVGDTSETDRTVPAGDYTLQVCVTGGDRCATSGTFSIVENKAVTYSVTTDKSVYNQGENISIRITATNITSLPQTLQFNNGCQTTYTIGTFDYMKDRACTMMLGSLVLPGYGSYTWTMSHDLMLNKLPSGTYNLQAGVIGYNSATTSVTIQ